MHAIATKVPQPDTDRLLDPDDPLVPGWDAFCAARAQALARLDPISQRENDPAPKPPHRSQVTSVSEHAG